MKNKKEDKMNNISFLLVVFFLGINNTYSQSVYSIIFNPMEALNYGM